MGEIVRFKRDVWGEEVILGVSWDLLYVVFMAIVILLIAHACLLYTSPSPRDGLLSRMPSSA